MTEEESMQVLARLTLHEFLLEVWYANWLADMPEKEAQTFARDFETRMHSPWVAADARRGTESEQGDQIAQDSIALTRRFLDKVRAREHEIRAKRS